MPAKPATDYDRIEPDWRAGVKSPAQIAAEYRDATGVAITRQAIVKHFKARGIPRDLAAKIRSAADAKVAASAVARGVAGATRGGASDTEIVDANAEQMLVVRLAHRRDIAKHRGLAQSMMDELEQQTGNMGMFEAIKDALAEGASQEAKAILRDAWQRAMSLGGRVRIMGDLATTLRTLIALEREAFGLAGTTPTAGYEETLAEVVEHVKAEKAAREAARAALSKAAAKV
jgi:hypothetical protein